MKLKFLPQELNKALYFVKDKVCELRLRIGYPIKVKTDINFYYLSDIGLSNKCDKGIICTLEHIEKIIRNVTEHSLYAHNEKIRCGFLDAGDGIRIGLSGECVFEGQAIRTIKNISSINIRIPHDINGCSNNLYKYLFENNRLLNSLIVSPPMRGKTTLLKDVARKLCNENNEQIMLVDERGEFSNVRGENIDAITYSDKFFAFEYGIRSLSPNIIITDELVTKADWNGVKYAVSCGVNVIASCHAKDMHTLLQKENFLKNVFDKYIFLNSYGGFGGINSVYNKDLSINEYC